MSHTIPRLRDLYPSWPRVRTDPWGVDEGRVLVSQDRLYLPSLPHGRCGGFTGFWGVWESESVSNVKNSYKWSLKYFTCFVLVSVHTVFHGLIVWGVTFCTFDFEPIFFSKRVLVSLLSSSRPVLGSKGQGPTQEVYEEIKKQLTCIRHHRSIFINHIRIRGPTYQWGTVQIP